MRTTTRKMRIGYAYTSTNRYPREPETVVVGETECDNAKLVDSVGFDNEANPFGGFQPMHVYKLGRRYYWQHVSHADIVVYDKPRYDENDVEQSGSWDGAINVDDDKHFVDKPLWWHKQGLSQTASGYGKRLVTSRCLWFNDRLHRVYVCCFSNTGTAYIESKGRKIVVR